MSLFRGEGDEHLGPAKLPWSQIPAPERSECGFWVALTVACLLWGLLLAGFVRLFWGSAS